MTKFICTVAVATLSMCFFASQSYAQNGAAMSVKLLKPEDAKILSENFIKRYKNGFLRHNPEGYMVKFSKKELLTLLESINDVDSINIVLGATDKEEYFSKSNYDGPKQKPLLIFQFKTLPSPNFLYGEYIFKVAGSLCPPPRKGCKVEETPTQN